jgi:hypothetical protein
MGFLHPLVGNQQNYIATPEVKHPMQDAFVPIPSDRDAFLLANVTVATVQRWRLGDDGLIQHKGNGSFLGEKSMV